MPLDPTRLPRVPLAHLPTPLEQPRRLAEAVGLPHLWMKRDDSTGLALGGNKARKLEFLVGDALDRGCDVLITTGGAQSNHARMTAAAARKVGMDCVLLLNDTPPAETQGNLLLDRVLGAEVRFMQSPNYAETHRQMEVLAKELRRAGRRPYLIPVGGSTPRAAMGYLLAVEELAGQWLEGPAPDAMVLAAGSTGTLTGVMLGARRLFPDCRIYGISVSSPEEQGKRRCHALLGETLELLGEEWEISPEEVPFRGDWLGPGYAVPTPEGMEAIRLTAATEGILLDPVYTGKAMAGLIGLARTGEIRPEERVVFWHTGGAPGLFAFPELFGV